jgi:hypothetical protein
MTKLQYPLCGPQVCLQRDACGPQAACLTCLTYTISIMCSSSSTLRCTWHSAWWFTLGKEPFSCRCWCTWVNTCLSGIRRQGYRSRYSSTAVVVLPLQTTYTKCISAYSSYKSNMFTVTAHCTVITARNDCSVCYLKHDWSSNMRKPSQCSSATLQLLLTQQQLQIGHCSVSKQMEDTLNT